MTLTTDLLAGLTPPQAEAVRHTDGPLLVLAGAGSGKTRVITRRAANIATSVARPDQVLAITFTNKAAGEMRERIDALGVGRGMWVCTFHSMCARLLRDYGDTIGLGPNFTIFDQADSRALIKRALAQCDLSADHFPPAKAQERISQAKSLLQTPADYVEFAFDFSTKSVARIYQAYQDLLTEQNGCDFDDLLMRVALMLKQYPKVRDELSDRFRYILIDEYQDTNHAQYTIASCLAQAHRNICATGDPDQSIYAWRGADMKNILEFETDYPDAKVVRLEQNFRSTGAILSAASELIAYNDFRKHKNLWTDGDRGANVRVWTCEDQNIESRQIAQDIQKHLEEGRNPGDIAIFYRVNALSRVMEDALRTARIPYQIARGVEFYNRKEIKDVLSYLRLIVNPADETALIRAINTPARGIGKVSLDRLKSYADENHITMFAAVQHCDAIDELKSAKKKVGAFATLMAELAALPESPVRDIVSAVLTKTGIEKSLVHALGPEDNDPLENVNELVSAAQQYDKDFPDGSLIDWLQQTSLVSDTDAIDDTRGAVTLMTLHAAKGLEFPIVYMIGLEEGLLPHARVQLADQSELEEERRLAFVGMTRSMHILTLTHALYRMVRGITERAVASRFLSELPDDEIERQTFAEQRDRSMAHLGRYNESEMSAGDSMYYPGLRVRHEDYGDGEVVGIETRLRSQYIRIYFRDHGERAFALDHVSLLILD
ncbi:MAG: UvrD-helicase domain-containing protein [Phycisphaerales bacterium]|nr:UvrD-helicase domain-containing protein [Phycisphaerales bacterium]MCB9856872.1 UvrD-helicase domain-containing protein [Phycisphaerales bacterium]MCB9862001.1 UvrD-helicase domain-containing protein [Phycisphaerales bacterium]